MCGLWFASTFLQGKTLSAETLNATYVDLLKDRHLAHLSRTGLVIPFDTGGHFKYLRGDWHRLWQFKPNEQYPHTTLTGRGELYFWADPDDAQTVSISLNARSLNGARAAVYVNRTFIGMVSLTARYTIYQLPPSVILPGQNVIEIIPKSSGSLSTPTLDLTYLHIGDDNGTQSPLSTSEPVDDWLWETEGGVTLRENVDLTYYLFLRGESRLRLVLSSGKVDVSVAADERPPASWMLSGTDGLPQILDLSRFDGLPVELTIRAVSGDAALLAADIIKQSSSMVRDGPRIRNAVVILVDTLRPDRLRTYNSDTPVLTTNVTRLARKSIVLENAFAQSNWTKPSVASLLTGHYPQTHGASTHRAKLADGMSTLPELLQRQGIATAGFSANGYISRRFGFGNGFDKLVEYGSAASPSRGRYVVRDAANWMAQVGQQRFFAYVHTTDVHAPYRSPLAMWRRYDSLDYHGVVRQSQTATLLNRIRAGSLLLSFRDERRLKAFYNGAISHHDGDIGYLLTALRAQGRLKDTALIFTSDHGEEFFEHGSVGHGQSLYDELVHVPLMIRLPKPVHRRVDLPVGLIDLFPTLCELLHVAAPSDIAGRSFLSSLQRTPNVPGEVIVSESPSQKLVSLRHKRFKAIFKNTEMVLYDMRRDGLERVDEKGLYPIASMAMADRLGKHLMDIFLQKAGNTAPSFSTQIDIDDETKAQLLRLGYLDE